MSCPVGRVAISGAMAGSMRFVFQQGDPLAVVRRQSDGKSHRVPATPLSATLRRRARPARGREVPGIYARAVDGGRPEGHGHRHRGPPPYPAPRHRRRKAAGSPRSRGCRRTGCCGGSRGSASITPSIIGVEGALSRSGRLNGSVANPSEISSISCSSSHARHLLGEHKLCKTPANQCTLTLLPFC